DSMNEPEVVSPTEGQSPFHKEPPDIKTLVWLAAQPRFNELPPKLAAREALGMWYACRETLTEEHKWQAGIEDVPIPWANQLPAKLEDFYRLVVKARDKIENQPRFKRWIRHTLEKKPLLSKDPEALEKELEKRFAEFQRMRFDGDRWQHYAYNYLVWWKHDL